jgi:hypothetical protein
MQAFIYVTNMGGVSLLVVVLYVDDITIMGSSLKDVKQLKGSLSSRYEMTDLGEIQSYLSMCCARTCVSDILLQGLAKTLKLLCKRVWSECAHLVH